MTDSAPTISLIIEREMPHPPEKIWRALTQGSLIQQWLMSNDFEPVVGHSFTFRSTPVPGWDGIIRSEVKVVQPPSHLAYSWATMGTECMVIWTLTPTADGTHLRMEQTGFASEQDRAYKGASYGWQSFLGKLEVVVGGLALS
jgi:uncharacterized protein YndB with AHSA1/START domain